MAPGVTPSGTMSAPPARTPGAGRRGAGPCGRRRGERPTARRKTGRAAGVKWSAWGPGSPGSAPSGCCRARRRKACCGSPGEGRAGEPVARQQPAATATQPGAGVGGAAAEHGRGEEAAAHRQVAHALRAARCSVSPGCSTAADQAASGRHVTPTPTMRPASSPPAPRTPARRRRAAWGRRAAPPAPAALRRAAGQVVGGGQQQRVEGAGERHADAAVAGPAGVPPDTPRPAETISRAALMAAPAGFGRLGEAGHGPKRTRSPGASRPGGPRCRHRTAPPVRPTSRQPPGLSQG